MIEEREAISLLFGLSVLAFVLVNRGKLRELRAFPWLLAAYGLLLSSWFFSVAEGFVWEYGLNLCQHVAGGLSALVFAWWCRLFFSRPGESWSP